MCHIRPSAPPEPIAILTQASGGRIDDQASSIGLSVFEGERAQTDTGGRPCFRQEFRMLPEGQIYRIYLDYIVDAGAAAGFSG